MFNLQVILVALSSPRNGSLGGLSGADKMCQNEARVSGLAGTFKAFLSGKGRKLVDLVRARYRRLPVVNIKV